MAPELIRSTIDSAIKKHPILATYTRLGRKERLERFPALGIRDAVLRRIEERLVTAGILSEYLDLRTFWGDRMKITRLSTFEIRRYGMIAGEELFLTKFIADRMKPGDIFIDGGAHVGWYTLLGSALAGDAGRVYAFEPTPRTMATLKQNTAKKNNIEFSQFALGKEKGGVIFHDFGDGHDVGNTFLDPAVIPHGAELAKGGTDIRVEVTTLDAFCADHGIKPNFIKFDLEGAEIEALEGARTTLQKYHPIVTCEAWSGRGFLQALIDCMKQFSYVPFELTERGAIPISFDIAEFDRPSSDGVFDQTNVAFMVK